MKKYNIYSNLVKVSIIFLIFQVSCTKQDHFYKEFVDTKIRHYAGKADSVKVFSGENRVKLFWEINDPSVNGATIYWNQKKDSLVVSHPTNLSSWEVFIPNLSESSHSFIIVTKDQNNQTSIPVQAYGTAYGNRFKQQVHNRSVRGMVFTKGNLEFNWLPESSSVMVDTEILFTNNEGNPDTIRLNRSENHSILPGYKPNTAVRFRSSFLPKEDAVDTLYSDSETFVPEVDELLDWDKFAEMQLPTDTYQGHVSLAAHMRKMWNDDITTNSNLFLTIPNLSPIPQWFTFDLGVTASLSKMKIWHRAGFIYDLGNLKQFEVYGSNDPNPDGSWESWNKIATFNSKKPSGLPLGQTSQADQDYINAGEDFIFDEGTPSYRYIRIKTLAIWGNVQYICIQKMQLWSNL